MSSAAGFTRRSVLASGAALLAGCTTHPAGRPSGGRDGSGSSGGSASLGFVGDVMLGRGVNEAHSERPRESVWGDVLPRLDALDGLFLNLECCLSTRGRKTPNRAYYFRADPAWAIPALERAGASWVGLANNHVLDFGRPAFEDTLAALDGVGIPRTGAGPNRSEAFAPATVDVDGLDVAVVAVTDQAPTYAAGAIQPGTAFLPMVDDPVTLSGLAATIRRARATRPDLLVVSLHWGPNWVTRPAGRYRRLARWLVDAGADVVHGHSAHVFQGVEVYRGRPIVHDAGDFVDDYALVGDLHNDRSFLFEVRVSEGRPVELRLHPVVIRDGTVTVASGEAVTWLHEQVRARSAEFDTAFERQGETLRCEFAGRE